MLSFKLIYSDDYYLPIGQHVFPAEKYQRVHQQLIESGTADVSDFLTPQPASDQDILLVHTPQYVNKLKTGTLSAREELQLEVPFSPELVSAFWLAAGGSILAAEHALKDGIAINIGGGFHHAFSDHGEGFCMIHDVAVAIRRMQRDNKIRTAMTVDCDVHQGNGTATIFAGDPSVFTCSLHGAKNYPFRKAQSSLDIELPDNTADAAYLATLQTHLPAILRCFQPQMVWYLAGVDPYVGDKLGRLALTLEGLRQRDTYVLSTCYQTGIPVVTTMGGGYAPQIEDIVEAHCNTVRLACRMAVNPGVPGQAQG